MNCKGKHIHSFLKRLVLGNQLAATHTLLYKKYDSWFLLLRSWESFYYGHSHGPIPFLLQHIDNSLLSSWNTSLQIPCIESYSRSTGMYEPLSLPQRAVNCSKYLEATAYLKRSEIFSTSIIMFINVFAIRNLFRRNHRISKNFYFHIFMTIK